MIEITKDVKDFGERIQSFKQDQNGCDIAVVLHDDRISLHSTVLAGNSDYFKVNLYSTPFIPREIILDKIDPKIAKQIFDYCYSNNMKIEAKDVFDISTVANLLMMDQIVKGCYEFSKETITDKNVYDIWTFAKKSHLNDLEQSCLEFVRDHFNEVSRLDGFVELDSKRLTRILQSKIVRRSESDVLNVIENWIQHDNETRSRDAAIILKHVNLGKLPFEVLVSKSTILCKNYECTNLLLEAMKKRIDNHSDYLPTKKMMVVGQANTVEIYSASEGVWTKVEIQFNKQSFSCFCYDNKLFVIGGRTDSGIVGTMESYDLKTWNKTVLPKMRQSRKYFVTVVVGHHVYAIGGYENDPLKSMERYNIENKEWTQLNSMPTARWTHGAAEIDGKIFVIGGYNGSNLSINECYTVSSGEWKICSSMKEKRAEISVAGVKGFIYAVGGLNGRHLSTVEKYDPKLDKWTNVQSMSSPRCGAASVHFEGTLVVSKGNSVEQYDPQKNQWDKLPSLNNRYYMHNMILF